MGVALALSLGLGTRDVASDIISGAYVKEIYSVDDIIEYNNQKGIITQIGNIKTIIRLKDESSTKEISIPNSEMIKQTITKII
jgi:small-conductance mechanosensitive channel